MKSFSWFGRFLADTIEQAVKEALAPLAPYLRKLAFGLVWIALATTAFSLMLLSVAASIFFTLAHLPYGWASLGTAGIFFLAGGICFLGGMTSLRRPR